jgi:guanosine-3',5'-bis(diphosphate) 3'-pyrophosphohydrolase
LGVTPTTTDLHTDTPTKGEDGIYRISDLCKVLDEYLQPEEISKVYDAFLFSAEAHDGQRRLTGEPYITHPIAAAHILAEMRMDHESIMAAILHDVIEDTPTAKKQLENLFGKEVSELVDGVTKLTQIDFKNQAEAQAENFRKMVLAMAHDIRVILIKLADRLHNMRTIGVMRPEKKRRVARETLEIYAPIAQRLGINSMRLELEDLAFEAMYPMRYRILKDAVSRARGNRKTIMEKIDTGIKRRLHQEELEGTVISRQKHLYSLYLKMRNKSLKFSDVLDVYAFRIIVDKIDTCYRVLGAMHNLYKPIPGSFKDYIAIPKSNGYQSLHTSLFGPHGIPIEIQIRTERMDRVAEKGIAAHWRYKTGETGKNQAEIKAREWMKELLSMQKEVGSSQEFIENVKIDLFPDEVYVFTPAGEIREFPRGATVVDFAYSVHSDVGHSCVAARVNRRPAPLSTQLRNGNTIVIITAKGADPNPAWLDFVTTARARSRIRAYLKNLEKKEAVELGKRLLDKALNSLSSSLEEITTSQMHEILKSMGLKSKTRLLEQIGLGNQAAFIIAKRLVPDAPEPKKAGWFSRRIKKPGALPIKGTEGALVSFARCCFPIPGDNIVGFTTAGRGIVIHRDTCPNVVDQRYSRDKWLDVQWDPESEHNEFSASIRVEVANKRGVLAIIATDISDMGSNIENVQLEERDGMTVAMNFQVTVTDRKHLANIMRSIKRLKPVMRITRNQG